MSVRTRLQVFIVLGAALEAAADEGWIGWNPARRAAKPKIGRYKPPASKWTLTQLQQFLACAREKEPDWFPLFAWIAYTGCRRGEACGLRWQDIDLDRGTAHIQQTRLVVNHEVVTDTPKSDAGARVLQLGDEAVGLLREWRRRQAERFLELGARPTHDVVFTDALCEPIHPDHIRSALARIIRTAGLPPVRLHDFRHQAIRISVAGGADAKLVSMAAGHSSVAFTLAAYYEPFEDAQKAAANVLGSAIGVFG